jgi:hypothetical protein
MPDSRTRRYSRVPRFLSAARTGGRAPARCRGCREQPAVAAPWARSCQPVGGGHAARGAGARRGSRRCRQPPLQAAAPGMAAAPAMGQAGVPGSLLKISSWRHSIGGPAGKRPRPAAKESHAKPGRTPTLDACVASVPPGQLCISAVTRGELLYPRWLKSCRYPLQELLLAELCAISASADDWVEVMPLYTSTNSLKLS